MNYNEFKDKKAEQIIDNIKKNHNNSFITINEDINFKNQRVIAIKDIHVSQDNPTTAGSKILENFVAPYTSTVVKLLKENNIHIAGTLNMDEFAMGFANNTSYFGGVDNAIDSGYIAGGSSGGSAYAVAAGLVPVATGTDTGGSVRQPAAFNGIYGMKPTYGLISRYGTIAFASSFDTVGILSNTIDDNIETLEILAQNDECDQTNFVPENYSAQAVSKEAIKKEKICYPKEWIEAIENTEIKKQVEAKITYLKEQGLEVEEVSIPTLKHAFELYLILAYAEASANLSRYDGVKYGLNNNGNKFDQYRHNFGYEVRKRLLIGAYMTSEIHQKNYLDQAQKIRTKMKQQFESVFQKYDLIIGPTTIGEALKKGEDLDDKKGYLYDYFLIPANLTGIPSMSIPIKAKENKMPLGLQILAPKYCEKKIYGLAKFLESSEGE